ncbi:MAG TPA: porin family protein [Salinimicrobium sp.]|nr:porin family protein [Salinimicrobium sp.]
MIKYLFFTLCLCCVLPLQAQLFSGDPVINKPNFDKQRWSWGYFLGFNTYDFDFDYNTRDMNDKYLGKDFSVDRTIGFNVGLVGNLRLNDHFDLRLEPGVSFNQINFQFFKADGDSFREINQTYVHIPLLLKFSTTRINNFKPFIVGGFSTSLNLSSNENNPDDNTQGQFRMTTNSYYYEIGFGIDFYLYYFKFTPSIRGVFALNDQLIRDDDPNSVFTRKVDKMSTRGIFINFTFQ